MKEIKDWKDAKRPLDLVLMLRHAKRAQPRCPGLCAGHWAIMDLPNAADGHVFLEYTYIRFKSGKIMRWCNSRAMRAIAELNDRGGRVELIREFQRMLKSGNAVVARLNPPIGVRSQSHLRSEAHKEMKRKSAEKSQHKRKNGIPPRKYTSPIARGLRQGNGLAHTWDE